MKRKLLSLVMAGAMALSLAACNGGGIISSVENIIIRLTARASFTDGFLPSLHGQRQGLALQVSGSEECLCLHGRLAAADRRGLQNGGNKYKEQQCCFSHWKRFYWPSTPTSASFMIARGIYCLQN